VAEGRDPALSPLSPRERQQLTKLYQLQADAPLWTDASGRLSRNARDALALLGTADEHGLDPADYGVAPLTTLMKKLEATPQPTAQHVAAFDTGLSMNMLRYLRHLHAGRFDPRSIGFQIASPADDHEFTEPLRAALASCRIADTAAEWVLKATRVLCVKEESMFSLGKILFPVDFSDQCLGAARYAVPTFAKRFNSEVTLLHVLPPYLEFGIAELGAVQSLDFIATRKEEARRNLDSFLHEELRDVSVKRVLVEGDPARQIVEYAHTENVGLIMMPTHGYGPFRTLLLGSVTSKVLHDADCPVLTGVHREQETPVEPMALRHILCAIDLGPHSAQTLGWADQLATEFKARLTVVHVVESLDPRTEDYYFSPEWREYVMKKAKEDLEAMKQGVGSRAEAVLEMGDVAKSVSASAKRLEADLLVIGRGAAAGGSGRFRTNAYAMIRQSPCPVLSV
jgi:nucleotide-binding universal stress UspA family protein